MFTHLLPKDDTPFGVNYSVYAKRHYLKHFQKDNPGRQWSITEEGIFEDLSRITYSDQDLQQSQQVDELWQKNDCWIFKYDFRIAGKQEATKNSGNRCIIFLDMTKKSIEILMIFHHKHMPKNRDESSYIEHTLHENFNDYLQKCK